MALFAHALDYVLHNVAMLIEGDQQCERNITCIGIMSMTLNT